MRMQLDRRSDLARRAEDALVVAFPLLGAVYLALEWGLTRLMGGYWGGLAAIALAAAPAASLVRLAFGGRTPRQAFRDGIWFGCAVSVMYAWAFTSPFVSLPGF